MKIPCGVIRDLLPLYVEDLASEETKQLLDEHLADCPDCREKLEELKQPATPEPDASEALRGVKKAIRRRRWQTALLAALLVFLPLFSLLARSIDKYALPWEKDLVRVESAEDGVLTLSYDGRVSAMESELCTDPDTGKTTLLLQGWSSRWNDRQTLTPERGILTFSDIPDCVFYGYGFRSPQKLLFGRSMNGGAIILPRLALGFYLLLSLAAAAVLGLLWLILRKKKAAPVLRALFFAALSYPIGHLLVKGTQTLSFFLPRDLAFILVAAAAIWGLMTLLWTILWRKWREKT